MPFLGGDAELGVGRAVALVTVPALDDLEEEALAVRSAVELEELAIALAIASPEEARRSASAPTFTSRPNTAASPASGQ